MIEVVCPRHGRIMQTDTIAYASLRCYFLKGRDRFCGLPTKIGPVMPLMSGHEE